MRYFVIVNRNGDFVVEAPEGITNNLSRAWIFTDLEEAKRVLVNATSPEEGCSIFELSYTLETLAPEDYK